MGIFRRFLEDLGLIRKKTVVVKNELTVSALNDLAIRKRISMDEVANQILTAAVDQQISRDSALDFWETLSIREQQVIALAVKGYTNNQIALILRISPSTVKTYIFTSSRKVGVDNRKELVDKFLDLNFEDWIRDFIGDHLPPIYG